MKSRLSLLNKKFLLTYEPEIDISLPSIKSYDLPVKVIQFGEGVFIRAFFNYFLDIANENSLFNGRCVVIQPRQVHKKKIMNDQDCLFTLCSRGLKNGQKQEDYRIISSISKAYAAKSDWNEILAYAEDPNIEIITSNTTEAGISYDATDKFDLNPPNSYPGKLISFLYHRYECFDASLDSGLIILPLELVQDNANSLTLIMKKLIKQWNLENKFLKWLENANIFCNTLVDRIVTGYPTEEIEYFRKRLKFEDNLLNTAELYHIWVIQGEGKVQEKLPLNKAGLNVLFVRDLTPYYLRKVRILNGAHTSFVHLSYLMGNDFVKQSVEDPLVGKFLKNFLFQEVIPSMNLPERELKDYANVIIERFLNPYIKHVLLNITLHSNSKMKIRILPTLLEYQEKFKKIPIFLSFSFAAYLYFMKISKTSEGEYHGARGDEKYEIKDDGSIKEYYFSEWSKVDINDPNSIKKFVSKVLGNKDYWEVDLNTIGNFNELVTQNLRNILTFGMTGALKNIL